MGWPLVYDPYRDLEHSRCSGLDRRTRGPEVKHSNSPRGRNPNQSCAMVSKRDPGIHGSGITPDGRSRDLHRVPKVWGMGYSVTPAARYVEYSVCVRCAHCVLVHTSSAAPGDVEYGRSGIQRSWDRDEWDHDPGDIQRMRSLVVRSYGDV